MVHDARIIPLDNRPLADKRIHQWHGESRGRWEGDTLVVESNNFSPRTEFRGSRDATCSSSSASRASRPNTMNYEMTVKDSTVWTKPWTFMVPLKATRDAIYEYACHEGNYRSMEGSLKGTRVLEQEATGTGQTTTSRQRQ